MKNIAILFILAVAPWVLTAQKSTPVIQTGVDAAVVQTNSGKVRG